MEHVWRRVRAHRAGAHGAATTHREALFAEHRQLLAELAALRQGAGIMVTTPGRLYPLVGGLVTLGDPRYLPREGQQPELSIQQR